MPARSIARTLTPGSSACPAEWMNTARCVSAWENRASSTVE